MRKYIEKALLERNSLRSICRIFGVSLTWLLSFAVSVWKSAPEDLGVKIKNLTSENLDFELDELCTFVGRKKTKAWVWIVLERGTLQIIAFEVGDRSSETCKKLWKKLLDLDIKGLLYTDLWRAYAEVLPKKQHRPSPKKGPTNLIERFNGTLRARCSRLVRRSYSFSKKWENLVIHLRYFFAHQNLSLHH